MLGDPITLTIAGSAKALVRINQDSYSSEYYLKETGKEYRVRVRHSKDRVAAGAQPRDRHVITLTETVYPTPSSFEIVRQSSVTIVGNSSDGATEQQADLSGLMAFLTAANVQKLINWDS